jgi:hypothetical protein
MREYSFQTFVTGNDERYIHQVKTDINTITYTNHYSFPGGILSLAYLDLAPVESLIQQIIDAVQQLASTQDASCEEKTYDLLDQLPEHHIYFLQLRADWTDRIYRAVQFKHYEKDLLPIEDLLELPKTLKQMQGQIIDLFANILDMDNDCDKPVSTKLIAYYKTHSGTAFHFRPQLVNFELISARNEEFFAEVLEPTTIYNIIDYHLRECIKREVKMRVCKNCGRYFAVTGRSTTEYCDRTFGKSKHTCKEMGAMTQWAIRKKEDLVFNDYRREYKKRFARMKAGKIQPEELYAWGERAREKKAECDSGKITPEEYSVWLRES